MSNNNNISKNPLSEILPSGFTVYSKSGCPNCTKVKKRLQLAYLVHKIVDCDDYLLDENDKTTFLSLMEMKIGKYYGTFPMVFYDTQFIGGWTETNAFVEKLLLSFEDNF